MGGGHDVILEIDWQGARQVKTLFPQSIGIYILPPSLEALKARLEGRGKDTAETIARRLAAAKDDMSHVEEFDYVIINNNFGEAVKDIAGVVRAQRMRRDRQLAVHHRLISELLQ